ncbi:MAG: lipopolysaccharide biosynthesis regulator YciM [Cocleimonas sp.]|jgi:lipopolysaccharide biosynthesis regulator YciM
MFALGQDFFAAGMLDRAESVFQELLESNNKHISKAAICESLRTIYEQTQEWLKAIEATECTKKSLKKDNSDTSGNVVNLDSLITHYYCELADESLQKGNLHEVDGFIDKAKKTYKHSTRLMSLQGDIAFHQKQYKVSLSHYLKAIQHDSRLLSMLFNKIDQSAKHSDDVQFLQKELLKTYQKGQDNNVFEALIQLADKYGSNDKIDKLVNDVLDEKKLSIKSIYKATGYVTDKYLESNNDESAKGLGLVKIHQSLENHLQGVPSFRCEHCGYKMHDYLWRCPACNHWDTVDQA